MKGRRQIQILPTNGFSLIEVMVALAILGVMFVSLFRIQASSIRMAAQARNISIAVGFAKMKLFDCEYEIKKRGFSVGDFNRSGNFSDLGYENITWECHAYAFKPPSLNPESIAAKISGKVAGSKSGLAGPSAAMLMPFFGMLTNALESSVRELIAIVKIGEQGEAQEIRLTTHLIDRTALIALGAGLATISSSGPGGGNGVTQPNSATPTPPVVPLSGR